MADTFEGKLFKPGAPIDVAELWPTDEYPAIPLLLEYAGNDHTGRGSRRSNDIYLLWKLERDELGSRWIELARCLTQSADWIDQVRPIAMRELARTAPAFDPSTAADISGRVVGMLDHELEMLGPADRHLVMSFIYQQVAARAVTYA